MPTWDQHNLGPRCAPDSSTKSQRERERERERDKKTKRERERKTRPSPAHAQTQIGGRPAVRRKPKKSRHPGTVNRLAMASTKGALFDAHNCAGSLTTRRWGQFCLACDPTARMPASTLTCRSFGTAVKALDGMFPDWLAVLRDVSARASIESLFGVESLKAILQKHGSERDLF